MGVILLADVSSTRLYMIEVWRFVEYMEGGNDAPKDGGNYDDDDDDEDSKDYEVYRG